MNSNLVVIEKETDGAGITFQVHAADCLDVVLKVNKNWGIAYEGSSYIEYAKQTFTDMASDYLTSADADEVWTKAVINEANYYNPVKACCKTQVNAEIAPFKKVVVNI